MSDEVLCDEVRGEDQSLEATESGVSGTSGEFGVCANTARASGPVRCPDEDEAPYDPFAHAPTFILPVVDQLEETWRVSEERTTSAERMTSESPRESGHASEEPQTPEDKRPVTWVQCERCATWRRLPDTMRAEDLPDVWHCEDATWQDWTCTDSGASHKRRLTRKSAKKKKKPEELGRSGNGMKNITLSRDARWVMHLPENSQGTTNHHYVAWHCAAAKECLKVSALPLDEPRNNGLAKTRVASPTNANWNGLVALQVFEKHRPPPRTLCHSCTLLRVPTFPSRYREPSPLANLSFPSATVQIPVDARAAGLLAAI